MVLVPFLTSYDPNDVPSGSIDPLGFDRGYNALAEAFLPGITNVASQPRYFSVLCLGALLGEDVAPGDRVGRTRESRLACILRLERFWALGNVLATGHQQEDGDATLDHTGMRGLTYVERYATHIEGQGARRSSARFPMLARQARYGVVGIYGMVAERLGLWDRKALSLQPDSGRVLAERFRDETAAPRQVLVAVREDTEVGLELLRQWGARAHVSAETTPGEARCLRDALLRDGMRARVAALLADHPPRDTEEEWEHELDRLERIARAARRREETRDIAALIEVILAFEEVYRWCLLGFERILFGCSQAQGGAVPLGDLAQDPVLDRVGAGLPAVRNRLTRALGQLRETMFWGALDRRLGDVLQLAENAAGCGGDVTSLIRILLRRHTDVQHGKFDRGQRKMPWVEDRSGVLTLTLARWGTGRADVTDPDEMGSHAYRTRAADALIRASRYGDGGGLDSENSGSGSTADRGVAGAEGR